jgi:hypothetical protein
MSESSQDLQRDSGALWSQMVGCGVDGSFKDVLVKLDEFQAQEDISPDLAETIRDVFFQLSQENPKRLNDLRLRASTPEGPSLKFILTQLEDGGGDYRIRKSAELISSRTGRESDDIRLEYMMWQGMVDTD